MFKRVVSHQLPVEHLEVKQKEQEIKERIAAKGVQLFLWLNSILNDSFLLDGIDLNTLSEEAKKYVMEERKRKLSRSLKDALINHQTIELVSLVLLKLNHSSIYINIQQLWRVFFCGLHGCATTRQLCGSSGSLRRSERLISANQV